MVQNAMALDLSKCYRAKVIDDNYKNGGAGVAPGAVKVNVEDWNAEKGQDATRWAYPLNASFLGSDKGGPKNVGQCLIPPIGSEVWVANEDNVPGTNNGAILWYFGSCGLNNVNTIPTENSKRSEPQKTYTLIRTPNGRGITVSDDSDESGIVIRNKNKSNGRLLNGSDMSISLSENSINRIVIQSGNGKQFITIDKDNNIISIVQGNSEIYMDDNNINISTSSTINLNAGKIYLNS